MPILAPALLPLLTPLAFALDRPVVDPYTETQEEDAYRMEEEMVTVASRYAQSIRQAPGIVTVVTDQQIRERGFLTLADVLRSIPGVYLSVAPEGFTLAWFRGVVSPDNNKILLLVDGVPWYDGIYNHAWVDEYIPLENVKQVEVIKGPGSVIYGTNAFAGVINVVTYKAQDLDGGFIRATAGTSSLVGAAFVMADRYKTAGGKAVSVSSMVRYLNTDGDGLTVNPEGESNVSGTAPRRSVNASLHAEVGPLSLAIDAVDYRHTYLTQPQDDTLDVLLQSVDEFNLSYKHQFMAARYRLSLGRNLELTPYLYAQHYDNPGLYAWFEPLTVTEGDGGEMTASFQTTLVETHKETARYTTGVDVETHPSANHVVIGGLGVQASDVIALEDLHYEDLTGQAEPAGFGLGGRSSQTLWDVFFYGQDTWSALYWLQCVGGLRFDYHSVVSGLFPSPRLGVLLIPTTNTTVKLLYGRAFRAPTARELLVQVEPVDGHNEFTAGNPNLAHERIDTVEAEALLDPKVWLRLRGAAFASSVKNEIDKRVVDTPGPLGDAFYDNFEKGASIVGAELEGTALVKTSEVTASLAWTRAVDRVTGYSQYEFPPLMGHLRGSTRLTDAVSATLQADIYGTRPRRDWSPDAHMKDGPPFTLVGASLATNLVGDGRLRADVSVHNLLNAEVETLIYRDDANSVDDEGYPEFRNDIQGPGRSITVGIEGTL